MPAMGAMPAESFQVNPCVKGVSVGVSVKTVPNFPAKFDPGDRFKTVGFGPCLISRIKFPGLHLKARPGGAFIQNKLTDKVLFLSIGFFSRADSLRWVPALL